MKVGRILSVVMAVSYLMLAFAQGSPRRIFGLAALVVTALACIFFGEELGGYTGLAGRIFITKKTPGRVIRFFGWLLLFLPPFLWLIFPLG